MISNFPFIENFVQQSFVNHVTNMVQNKLNKGKPQHREVEQANLNGTMHNLSLKNSTQHKWQGTTKNTNCGSYSSTTITSIFCS